MSKYNDLSRFDVPTYPDVIREKLLLMIPTFREMLDEDAEERGDIKTSASDEVIEAAVIDVFGKMMFDNFIQNGNASIELKGTEEEQENTWYDLVNACSAAVSLMHMRDIGILDGIRNEEGELVYFLKNIK